MRNRPNASDWGLWAGPVRSTVLHMYSTPRLQIRMTAEELAAIVRAAKALGMGASTYVRMLALREARAARQKETAGHLEE